MRFRHSVIGLAIFSIASLVPSVPALAADTVSAAAQGGRYVAVATSSNTGAVLAWNPNTSAGVVGYQIPSVGGVLSSPQPFQFHDAALLPSPSGVILPASTTTFTDTRTADDVYCYSVGVLSGNPPSFVANSDVVCQRPRTASASVGNSALAKANAGAVAFVMTPFGPFLAWTDSSSISGTPTYSVTVTNPLVVGEPQVPNSCASLGCSTISSAILQSLGVVTGLPGSANVNFVAVPTNSTSCFRVTANYATAQVFGSTLNNLSVSQDMVCWVPGQATLQPGAQASQVSQSLTQVVTRAFTGK